MEFSSPTNVKRTRAGSRVHLLAKAREREREVSNTASGRATAHRR